MKHTTNFFLYAWTGKNLDSKINLGKKVSNKTSYVSSASAMSFWNAYGADELNQYCIFESEDEEVISAAEWWALNYGMSILGKTKFYNILNNAHKGDQSLVTEEIKQKIVDFYEGKLTPESYDIKPSLGANIIDKIENGFYPVVELPVFELNEYQANQVRAVERNIDGENDIVLSYKTNPKQVLKDITPLLVVESADGTRRIGNGHTRIGAASRCKGWNKLPACIVSEKEFGETEVEIETNILLAGSYANRRSPVYTKPNTDEDLVFQMQNYMALNKMDPALETARKYIREHLSSQFAASAGSKNKASGIVTKIFNKFDKEQIELSITKNMITYSDGELTDYCYQNYESKGVAVVRSTMSSMDHFNPIGYIFNHVAKFKTKPKNLAIVLHCRNKTEYVNEQSNNKVGQLRDVLKDYNMNFITIEVLPSFKE